ARAAQALGVPLISIIATHPDIAAVGDRIFSVCFDDHAQAGTMAAFAHATLGARTAVILTDLNSAYGLAMTTAFRERFTALGGRILAEIPYKMRQRDFDDQLRQVAQVQAEVLFMPGYWVDGAPMVKRLAAFEISSVPLAGDGWGSGEFETRRGEYPRHGYYTDHWASFMEDEASKRFTRDYTNRFKRPPVAGSALAYDAVRVAALAAKRAGSTRPEDLTHALASVRNFPGITGSITFNAGGKAQKDIHIMEIVGGKSRLLKTVKPGENP
ncbi:MAG: ABC transporter substrate-binding protein, partial [Desulfovibrio sp.]|nr:ABC transporter substrate-binding protein [Desulfovibrio sp.]